MKTLILFAVLLGVAYAKPGQAELKKLTQLLKKVLAKKDEVASGSAEDDGSAESDGSAEDEGFDWPPPEWRINTTLFDGLGEEYVPFKLFGGVIDIDFTEPLKVNPDTVGEFMEEVRETADAISDIAGQIVEELHSFAAENAPGDIDLKQIANFTAERLEPLLYSNPKANVENVMTHAMVGLIQGAIAGTEGKAGERKERGCNFDDGEQELMECVLNKMFLVTYASEVAVGEAQFMLEIDLEQNGKFVRPCDHVYNYLMSIEFKDPEPAAVLGAFKDTMVCLRNNIETIRDRIGMKVNEAFPGAPGVDKPDLPLPFLLKTQAFLQHIGAQSYWAMETVYGVMFSIYMDEEFDKKAVAHKKMLARHTFVSRTAKAYTRSKVPLH